ncbi:MAG: aldehyde dehydrogenase [Planctomycetota bacterium]
MSLIQIRNFIGGQHVDPIDDQWLDNVEPATGRVYSNLPNSNANDIEAAASSAEQAQPGWASLSIEERSKWLFDLADAIDDYREELVRLESQDNGKPERLARNIDIPRCSKNIRHFAATVMGRSSESHAMNDAINYTLRQPVGVVGVISPWNLPLYLLTWKIAPALATGNCVIAKPSEVTPMTAFKLSEICEEISFPPGVLNIVHGEGTRAGDALLKNPSVKAVSFTGGTATGKHVASTCAPLFKKYSLELGGKNPNIIFEDCDYERMLSTTVQSSFSNQGQICLCGSRIYVQSGLFKRFKEDFVSRATSLLVGDPCDGKSSLGAVVSKQHYEKILSCIESARAEGGEVLCGGGPVNPGGRCSEGYFIEPTVIDGLGLDAATCQTEIFGPVVTIHSFKDESEAVELANGTDYGLSASVWTADVGRAHRMAEEIEAGVVWVNCWLLRDLRTPFGGVKNSGVGREGGEESLRFFTQSKNVCIKY